MFETEPRGGPHVNFSSTASESLGISLRIFSLNLTPVVGPKPAGESPNKFKRFPDSR